MQKTVSQYNRSRGVYCPFKKKSNNDDDVAAGMANSSEFKKSTRKKPSNTKMLSKTDFARNYLHGLPKLEFHYGRKSSNKLYLDPVIRSMCQLYNLYCEFSKSKGIDDVVSWCAISNFFDQMNLSIHPIKKDKCDTCVKDEVGQLDDKDWQKHRARKDRARDEKEQDKINAMKNECKVVTMDLQAVKVLHDPVVTDLRALRYLPTSTMEYKIDFDAEWAPLPQKVKQVNEQAHWPPMYKEARSIKKEK
ncbi:uncharacterized protein [Diabrotica undecimpunctata]|uniref:uncharacterized protein isoform X2 n=1 Tax=Diabrotica undecimpunctata TaxID=50387 RepID=UPI003B640A49